MLQSQPRGPITDGAAGRAGGEALTALPGAAVCHFFQQRAALTHAGGGRGGKRNDGLAGEVIVLYEIVDRPRRNAPPDGIANEHGVILIPVCGGGLGQGDVPQGLVVMLTVDTAAVYRPVQISGGIGGDGRDLENIRAQFIRDVLCHALRVSRAGEVGHENFAGSFVFSKNQRKWERLSARGKNGKGKPLLHGLLDSM